MKRILGLILIGIGAATAAETFRTDINPALLYYQGFSLRPELGQADYDYLYTNEWRNKVLDERYGNLVTTYKNSFKLFRRAGKAEVPCDWGLDLTDGPEALLPGLAKAKNAAQTARLRTMWHLQNGKPDEARDDLLAAFALGRNVSHDRVLISALVQYAIENIVASIIAENFYQLPPETLVALAAGLEAAPRRGLVAQCIATEKTSFGEYYGRKIRELQAADGTRAVDQLRELLVRTFGEEGVDAAAEADDIIRAGGNSAEGVLKLFDDLAAPYEQMAGIMSLPAGRYEKPLADFLATADKHLNPLIKKYFRVFDSCRKKELAAASTVAMARAGIAYKLRGEEGLRGVLDPCTGGLFEFERFVFEGVDRGFRLRSQYRGRDFDEILIFVEKPGPLFRTTGKLAGEKVK